ncbi:MAG TPA: RluA family pseudouridine synthase [Bacteroidales bacterium]|nr:RluA family pseudouridine synthase [Bacteroidales bacterium]HRZ77810.1 RluA family pseudouridine synthase [Bacteroidales bacterium]
MIPFPSHPSFEPEETAPELSGGEVLEEADDDLFERYRFTVDKGQSLLRIDKFLTTKVQNATRNKVQAAARAGNILVNGNPVKPNYRVKPLDEISVLMEGEPRDQTIHPENIPLDIVYEDDHLLVVNKVAGMVVHPGHNNYTGTLVHALAWHLMEKPEADSGPLLVHRIDKDTSGILVVAKNETAQSALARQFFEHSSERHYLALVWGDLAEGEGTIRGHIGRSLKDRKVMSVFPDGAHGKEAVTHWKVLERFNYVTLVDCRLETGRTHQIRAHFRYLGHPLFNDARYGGNAVLRGTTFTRYRQFVENCFQLIPRQALHAATLAFDHPVSRERMRFESPLPEDFRLALEKWRRYAERLTTDD